MAVRTFSISAGLAASTVTPGSTAPGLIAHDASDRAAGRILCLHEAGTERSKYYSLRVSLSRPDHVA